MRFGDDFPAKNAYFQCCFGINLAGLTAIIGILVIVFVLAFKDPLQDIFAGMFYKIRFFCEPNDRPGIRRAVMKTLHGGLDEAGVKIPYRQIDVHNK